MNRDKTRDLEQTHKGGLTYLHLPYFEAHKVYFHRTIET
jgi:hypothetical protein